MLVNLPNLLDCATYATDCRFAMRCSKKMSVALDAHGVQQADDEGHKRGSRARDVRESATVPVFAIFSPWPSHSRSILAT